jgi:hypothetical protein
MCDRLSPCEKAGAESKTKSVASRKVLISFSMWPFGGIPPHDDGGKGIEPTNDGKDMTGQYPPGADNAQIGVATA